MNGYEKRSLKKREAILDAAQELFFKRGITEVSVAEIAALAKVSQVTLYNYFGSKENLAQETIKRYMNRAMDDAERLLELDIPFHEKVKRMFTAQQEHADTVSDNYFHSVEWDDPAIQAFYQAYALERSLPFFRRFVEQGQKEGVIEKDLSFEAIATYIMAFRQMFSQPDYLKTERKYKEDLGRLFFYGLLGK